MKIITSASSTLRMTPIPSDIVWLKGFTSSYILFVALLECAFCPH